MFGWRAFVACVLALSLTTLPGCGASGFGSLPSGSTAESSLRVMATTTILADITQHVVGRRAKVDALIPLGLDPHEFEPSPADVARVAGSRILIVNGGGYEAYLDRLLTNAGGQRTVITASSGLTSRTPRPDEFADSAPREVDPHFWMDPTLVIKYVDNIRDGLSAADPAGAQEYAANAQAYSGQLKDLDSWIAAQVKSISPDQRLLVTNHESLGYYADRYGFRVVGTIIPSVTSEASPSAQQVARLVDRLKSTKAKAIFLEPGTNTQMAEQIASETGMKVVSSIYTESLSDPRGPAPTYVEMLRHDTQVIVEALR